MIDFLFKNSILIILPKLIIIYSKIKKRSILLYLTNIFPFIRLNNIVFPYNYPNPRRANFLAT